MPGDQMTRVILEEADSIYDSVTLRGALQNLPSRPLNVGVPVSTQLRESVVRMDAAQVEARMLAHYSSDFTINATPVTTARHPVRHAITPIPVSTEYPTGPESLGELVTSTRTTLQDLGASDRQHKVEDFLASNLGRELVACFGMTRVRAELLAGNPITLAVTFAQYSQPTLSVSHENKMIVAAALYSFVKLWPNARATAFRSPAFTLDLYWIYSVDLSMKFLLHPPVANGNQISFLSAPRNCVCQEAQDHSYMTAISYVDYAKDAAHFGRSHSVPGRKYYRTEGGSHDDRVPSIRVFTIDEVQFIYRADGIGIYRAFGAGEQCPVPARDIMYYAGRDSWCLTAQAERRIFGDPSDDDDSEDESGEEGMDEATLTMGDYHSSRGQLRGWGRSDDPLTIGIELECCCNEDDSRRAVIANILPELRKIVGPRGVFAERDGSLPSDTGFELVFGWASVADWTEAAPKICAILRDNNIEAYRGSNCGLHINVAIPENDAVKALIASLVFRDHLEHNGSFFWDTLARRKPNDWCRVPSNIAGNYQYGHHYAVSAGADLSNSSRDQTVISVRMFKSTSNDHALVASIQFVASAVAAACKFSAYRASSVLDVDFVNRFTTQRWVDYVLDHWSDYPQLIAYYRAYRAHKHTPAFGDFSVRRAATRVPIHEALKAQRVISTLQKAVTFGDR